MTRHDAVADAVLVAIGGQKSLSGTAHVVDTDKILRLSPGVDHGHRSSVAAGKEATLGENLDLLPHPMEQRLPVADD